MRRKFFDLHESGKSPTASEALRRIQALYAIEDNVRGRPPDERRRVREKRAGPLLAEIRTWLDETLHRTSRRSHLAASIRYALSRWTALTRYAGDGRIEIDNNPVERAIRPIALGRKNWLFAGSDAGGTRAAAIASLIATAQLNGLDPEAYLRHVLGCIAGAPRQACRRTAAVELHQPERRCHREPPRRLTTAVNHHIRGRGRTSSAGAKLRMVCFGVEKGALTQFRCCSGATWRGFHDRSIR